MYSIFGKYTAIGQTNVIGAPTCHYFWKFTFAAAAFLELIFCHISVNNAQNSVREKILAIIVLLGIHKALCKIQNGGGSHFEKKPK